jgi:hypothetical protein
VCMYIYSLNFLCVYIHTRLHVPQWPLRDKKKSDRTIRHALVASISSQSCRCSKRSIFLFAFLENCGVWCVSRYTTLCYTSHIYTIEREGEREGERERCWRRKRCWCGGGGHYC